MAATTYWTGNQYAQSQVVTVTVSAVATSGVLSATTNGKVVSYTVLPGDTLTSATAAWFALLANPATAPAEFQQLTWVNLGSGVFTATAKVAGTPFTGITGPGLAVSGTGGCSVALAITTINKSPNDVADPQNWMRNGVAALPQYGDQLVIAGSAVDLLWNLDALAAIQLNGYTRYQTFTATIGLPDTNPAGYVEWRQKYFKLLGGGTGSSSSSVSGGGTTPPLQAVLGFGPSGTGPTRERYDFQAGQVNLAVLAAGSPSDAYSVYVIGTNAANAMSVTGVSVGVAMLPGETASLTSASVTNGGTLDLGPGVSMSGTLTVTGATSDISCLVPTIIGQNNSTLTQGTTAANLTVNYPSVAIKNGTTLTWLSPSSLTLVLQTSSTFDKSQDQRAVNMNGLTIDIDSCTVNDPYGAINYTQTVTTRNALQTGPFRGPPGYRIPINA